MSDYGQSAQARVEAHRASETHTAIQPANLFLSGSQPVRASETVYQNTGARPLFISVTCTQSGATTAFKILSDAANPPTTNVCMSNYSGHGGDAVHACAIILPTHYYKIANEGGGTTTKLTWTEAT